MSNSLAIGFTYNTGNVDPVRPESFSTTPNREITWDPVERWLREKRPTTKRIYEIYMDRFLESTGKRLGFNDENGFLTWANRQGEGIAVPEAMESFGQTQSETVRATALSALKTFLERNGYRHTLTRRRIMVRKAPAVELRSPTP